jgi:hypothetical protein
MQTVQMINRLPSSSVSQSWSPEISVRASESRPPSIGQRFDEILPLLDVVPEAGPPVLFVLGPWLVLVMMLIGPFVLLMTLLVATVLLGAVAAATVAVPYFLVRHLRKRWSHRPAHHVSAPRLGGSLKVSLLAPTHSHTDVTSN